MRGINHISGQKFGRLTVVARMPPIPGARNAMWNCLCDCGKYTLVQASHLGKLVFSCGCLKRETAAKSLEKNRRKPKHGMSGAPEYQAWSDMKMRCYNPDSPVYEHYGARGISVCDIWKDSFESFFADMGKRPSNIHSIGRIDNEGNYGAENCRWEVPKQQNRNTRFNRIVTVDGISLCVTEWCEMMGVSRQKPYRLTQPLRSGISRCATIDEAVEVLYREWQSP